jgi:hypothetical protein
VPHRITPCLSVSLHSNLHFWPNIVEATLVTIFAVDIGVNFFVAYSENDAMVDDQTLIASRYLRCASQLIRSPGDPIVHLLGVFRGLANLGCASLRDR